MPIDWADVAYQIRAGELQARALALSKLRAREWRKQQLARGDNPSASQVSEVRRDLSQCALGELWERFSAAEYATLADALTALDALKLRYLPNWGQPANEQPPAPYVPPVAYRHFSPLQRRLLAMAAAQLPERRQLAKLKRTAGGRQLRTLRAEQLQAIASAVVVADLVSVPFPFPN